MKRTHLSAKVGIQSSVNLSSFDFFIFSDYCRCLTTTRSHRSSRHKRSTPCVRIASNANEHRLDMRSQNWLKYNLDDVGQGSWLVGTSMRHCPANASLWLRGPAFDTPGYLPWSRVLLFQQNNQQEA